MRKTLGRLFVAGLLVTVPAAATLLVMWWLFTRIDDVLQPVAEAMFGGSIAGAGIFLLWC